MLAFAGLTPTLVTQVYSRFTCLFYLNDSFTKGETTFFVPDPLREGVLDARPVKPLMGAALVFPVRPSVPCSLSVVLASHV